MHDSTHYNELTVGGLYTLHQKWCSGLAHDVSCLRSCPTTTLLAEPEGAYEQEGIIDEFNLYTRPEAAQAYKVGAAPHPSGFICPGLKLSYAEPADVIGQTLLWACCLRVYTQQA